MHDKQKNKNKTKQDKQMLAKYNNNHAVFCHPRTDILPAPVQIAKYMIGRLLVPPCSRYSPYIPISAPII